MTTDEIRAFALEFAMEFAPSSVLRASLIDAGAEIERLKAEVETLRLCAERAEHERDEALGWIGYYFRSASEWMAGTFTKADAVMRGRGVVFRLDVKPADEGDVT